MVAAKQGRDLFPTRSRFDRFVGETDWVRVHHQAVGRHARNHDGDGIATCGWCIMGSLLHPIEESGQPQVSADDLLRRMRAQHHKTGSYAAQSLLDEVDDYLEKRGE